MTCVGVNKSAVWSHVRGEKKRHVIQDSQGSKGMVVSHVDPLPSKIIKEEFGKKTPSGKGMVATCRYVE